MMTKVKYPIISVIGVLAVVAFGCGGGQEAADDQPVSRITNVRVYPVEPMPFTEYIQLPVIVRPYREVELGLTNGGEVTAINADKGDVVRRGTVLLETDATLAEAQFRTARANLEYQESEHQRNQHLLDQGGITQAAFDAVELQHSLAQSSLDQARKQVENAVIEAPFAGIITSRSAEIGAILSPGVSAFRLIDMSSVKVLTGIPEKYIGDFEVGSTVDIKFDAYPDTPYTGEIGFLSPEADPVVRTFLAEIIVDNRNGSLRAGIMGDAMIQRRMAEEAVVIPLNAVIEGDAGRLVYVVDGTIAEPRIVELGSSRGEYVHVTSGIATGDRVVVVGQYDVVEGETVNVTGEMTIDREEVSAR